MTDTATLLDQIDDRSWRALPAELRWKVIPWALDGGELEQADRLIEATERKYWQPDEAMLNALRQAGEELEDKLEGAGARVAA